MSFGLSRWDRDTAGAGRYYKGMRSSLPLPACPGYCAGVYCRFLRASFAVAGALLLCFGAGCPSPQLQTGGRGSLSIPQSGSVRIVATEIQSTDTTRQFKWTIIGERNWTRAEAKNGVLSLGATYPLNTVGRRDGTNIWEADVMAKVQGDSVAWETRLHGIHGVTVKEAGQASLGGRAFADVFQVRQSQGVVPSLPADLALVRIGERDLRLKIDQ